MTYGRGDVYISKTFVGPQDEGGDGLLAGRRAAGERDGREGHANRVGCRGERGSQIRRVSLLLLFRSFFFGTRLVPVLPHVLFAFVQRKGEFHVFFSLRQMR